MGYYGGTDSPDAEADVAPYGRWPANVVLDEEAAARLDDEAGDLPRAGGKPPRRNVGEDDRVVYREGWHGQDQFDDAGPLDEGGGPSRFFYTAKASRGERNAGLDGRTVGEVHRYGAGIGEGKSPEAPSIERNVHPTVKPLALMRWLCRLVTPGGGLVLDPFTGSGTTGCAAVLEGFDFIGIEREAEYVEIAKARIAFWSQYPGQDIDRVLGIEATDRAIRDSGQMGLLSEEAA